MCHGATASIAALASSEPAQSREAERWPVHRHTPSSALGCRSWRRMMSTSKTARMVRGGLCSRLGVHRARLCCHHQRRHSMCSQPEQRLSRKTSSVSCSCGPAGGVTLRAFRNAAGSLRGDASEGSDSWAVSQGYVAVTPVGLRSGELGGGGGVMFVWGVAVGGRGGWTQQGGPAVCRQEGCAQAPASRRRHRAG